MHHTTTKQHTTTQPQSMYGFIDLDAPQQIYTRKTGVTTLVEVWREIETMANCGIVRLADSTIIYKREDCYTRRNLRRARRL